MTRSRLSALVAALSLLLLAGRTSALHAQALPTATRSGGYISVGGTFSGYQSLYNKTQVAGGTVYADANLTRRLGLEGEARFLRLHTQSDTRTSTYLVGPRISTSWPRYRPYVKGLVGMGKFTFPYNYAQGSYFVVAPGAGLEIPVMNGRVNLRVVDFEYQAWRGFNFGRARPYGFSTGLSVRVF